MESKEKPNVVFFMVDQLSARWIEEDCEGVIPTPSLDRVRSEGVNFSQCFSSNPVCCPTRATLATGLATRGHGVLQNGYHLDPELPTFMRALQHGGWRTGAFGKVHYHAHYSGVHPDYRPYGFDVVHNTEDPRAGEWLDWVAEVHPEHLQAALATAWPLNSPELRQYGPEGIDLKARIQEAKKTWNWAQGAYADSNEAWHYTLPFPEEVSQSAWITGHATRYINETPADQPLLAHISYVAPHSASSPPERCMELVDVDRIPEPAPIEWREDRLAPKWFSESEGAHETMPEDWRRRRQYYFADVAHLDEQLGKVIETLEATGRWDNTYLIVLSDHGELLLDHGFTGKAERHYDASIRVPLIIRGPGLLANHTCDAIVQLEDICPTVLDMTRAEWPALPHMGNFLHEPGPSLPGQSLLPACLGRPLARLREEAYCESFNNLRSYSAQRWARTVRTMRWRYTLYPQGAGEQLFDLQSDPGESINLAGDPAYSAVRHEMRDRLLEQVILQDHPHSPRDLYAHGVH